MLSKNKGTSRGDSRRLAYAVILYLALTPGYACAATIVFDLPAQPLAKALHAFAAQADVSIGLSTADAAGKTSPLVRGAQSPEAALQRLLEGSSLSFEMVDATTFRIFPTPAKAAQARPATEDLEVPTHLDVIIVTASKRLQSLQTVPSSVVAITRDQLRHYGVRSTDNIPAVVAGLSATNQGPGRNKFFVRGLSDGAFSGNAQASVATYIDEVRTSFNGPDPNLQLVDIDRVEVVRGPQGALYGAGPISGLVRIVTTAPQLDTLFAESEIYTTGGAGAGRSGGASAVLNAPLVENRMALRAVAYMNHSGGFITDARLGKSNTNETNIEGMRAQTRLALSDAWDIRTGATAQWIHARDTQYLNQSQPHFSRSNLVREPYTNDFVTAHATVEGDLAWASLLSTTAWSRQNVDTRFDASLAVPLILHAPVTPAAFDEVSTYTTFDHETRLTSASGQPLEWLAGAFASRSVQRTTTRIAFTVPASVGSSAPFYFRTRHGVGTEFALFGEATYTIYPTWSVTLGLRLYRGLIDVTGDNSELDDGPPEAVGQSTGTGVTPKATLGWRPDIENLFYASIGQGFRLGGVNVNNRISPVTPRRGTRLTVTNFDSDHLWNFELGAKSELLDGRLRINSALFYAIWEHIQADLTRSTGLSFTANLGSVRNAGIDFDLNFVPVRGLELFANAAYNNPKLTEDPTLAPGTTSRFPRVPKFSGFVGTRYQHAVDDSLIAFGATRLEFTGKTTLGQGFPRAITTAAYALMNAEIGLRRGSWEITLTGDNLFNSAASTFAPGNPFNFRQMRQITPPRPRSIGLRANWKMQPLQD